MSKYNTTEISAESFTGLMQFANKSMGGGLAYGMIFVFWLVSMSVLAQYPNVDTLKASTYTAWLSSVLFAVFELVSPAFPMALFILVAGLTAYQEVIRQ